MTSPYVSTISGKHYHLVPEGGLSPEQCLVDIEDIAHHLTSICRYTGATKRHYSVAEHSLLCADIASAKGLSDRWQLAALLHDAHEAYLGDVAQPIKEAMKWICTTSDTGINPWEMLEQDHAQHVYQQLGVASIFCGPDSSLIKQIDLMALAHEKATIGPPDTAAWPSIQGIALEERWLQTIQRRGHGWSRHHIRCAFLDRYYWLSNQIAGQQGNQEQSA